MFLAIPRLMLVPLLMEINFFILTRRSWLILAAVPDLTASLPSLFPPQPHLLVTLPAQAALPMEILGQGLLHLLLPVAALSLVASLDPMGHHLAPLLLGHPIKDRGMVVPRAFHQMDLALQAQTVMMMAIMAQGILPRAPTVAIMDSLNHLSPLAKELAQMGTSRLLPTVRVLSLMIATPMAMALHPFRQAIQTTPNLNQLLNLPLGRADQTLDRDLLNLSHLQMETMATAVALSLPIPTPTQVKGTLVSLSLCPLLKTQLRLRAPRMMTVTMILPTVHLLEHQETLRLDLQAMAKVQVAQLRVLHPLQMVQVVQLQVLHHLQMALVVQLQALHHLRKALVEGTLPQKTAQKTQTTLQVEPPPLQLRVLQLKVLPLKVLQLKAKSQDQLPTALVAPRPMLDFLVHLPIHLQLPLPLLLMPALTMAIKVAPLSQIAMPLEQDLLELAPLLHFPHHLQLQMAVAMTQTVYLLVTINVQAAPQAVLQAVLVAL